MVVPLEQWHIDALRIQENQKWIFEYLNADNYAQCLVEAGPAFTLLLGNSIVVGCAGVWIQEPHRGLAWALVSGTIGTDYIHFHKHVKEFVDNVDIQRLEMAVETNFKQGFRWAEMLGFTLEGLMHKYYPNGSDAYLFAKVK